MNELREFHQQMVGRAIQLQKAGKLADAEAIYQSVLQANPRHADALHLYGCLCDSSGQTEKGAGLVQRAIEVSPNAYPYFCNLANMLVKLGRTDEAVANYQAALQLKPNYAQAFNNLGLLRSQQGDRAGAKRCFQQAIACLSAYADPHYHLAMEYRAEKDANAAVAAFLQAIRIRPDHADAYYNLGNTYAETQHVAMAVDAYQMAIRLRPQVAATYTNLGAVLMRLGRVEEAAHALREACRLDPTDRAGSSNLILLASYASADPALVHAECARFEMVHCQQLSSAPEKHARAPQPERTPRIGYVSADFRQHAAAYWIEPVLAGHAAGGFDVVCYNASREPPDEVSTRLKALVGEWVDCANLGDEELAQRIRQDGIDILVDLSGHTEGNRLMVFARKPAPVQVSWFGFPASTGLKTMDYRLTDAELDPIGESDQYYSEKLVRLGRFYAAFQPDPLTPAPGAGPLGRNGYVTFGSLNNFTKVTPAMLDLWCDILLSVPRARLLLQAGGLDSAEIGDPLRQFFARRGVDSSRLVLHGWTSLRDFLALGSQIDIALDPFPFNGGVTTFHALWMGLPLVTLSGQSAASRVGRSILHRMGLGDLVASTPAQYQEIARGLARDGGHLAQLRASLRERMVRAGLLDGHGLVQEVEAAYRTMWRTWCAGQ